MRYLNFISHSLIGVESEENIKDPETDSCENYDVNYSILLK